MQKSDSNGGGVTLHGTIIGATAVELGRLDRADGTTTSFSEHVLLLPRGLHEAFARGTHMAREPSVEGKSENGQVAGPCAPRVGFWKRFENQSVETILAYMILHSWTTRDRGLITLLLPRSKNNHLMDQSFLLAAAREN